MPPCCIIPLDRLGAATQASISTGGADGSASECAVFHDRRPTSSGGLLIELTSIEPFKIYASATRGREPVVISTTNGIAPDCIDFERVLSWSREDNTCIVLDMIVDHIVRFPKANDLSFAALASVHRAASDAAAIRVVSLAPSADGTHIVIDIAVDLCIQFKTLSVLIPRSADNNARARFSTNDDERVISELSHELSPVHHTIFARKQIPFHQTCFEEHVRPHTFAELFATRTNDNQLVLDRTKDDANRRPAAMSAFDFELFERMYMKDGKVLARHLSTIHHNRDHALVYFLEHTSAGASRTTENAEPRGVVRVCFDVDADWCPCDIRVAMCVNH